MFHPVFPPQPPPNLVSSKPVDYLASTAVISAEKINLSIGEKTPSLPLQNIIEFKLRNPQDQSKPVNLEVPPLPQISETEKISPQKTRIVEVIADRQEYDQERRIVTAEGNVVVRFDGAVIDADTLHINLDNLIAVGEGNVALTRGDEH